MSKRKEHNILEDTRDYILSARKEVEKVRKVPKKKNREDSIILIVGKPTIGAAKSIYSTYKKHLKSEYKIGLIVDKKERKGMKDVIKESFDPILYCDFSDRESIIKELKKYEGKIKAATCRSEGNIPDYRQVISHLPYIKAPSTKSLIWTTNKTAMRKMLRAYDKDISPKFTLVTDTTKKTVNKIEKDLNFPVICKPAGLAASVFVSIAYHPDELQAILKKIFKNIEKMYKRDGGRGEPQVLVEQFIEGELYSTDGYVTSRGKIYFSPFVYIKTGRSIGFDDFFGYQQMTPTKLNKTSIESAEKVATKAVRALGLRSSTAHIELLKTEDGWKVVEVGPRLGGFRNTLYKLAFGIDSTLNDILIRIPKAPIIPRKTKGYAAALKIFAKTEGKIDKIKGMKKIKELKSLQSLIQNKKAGDKVKFAKNGGKSVMNLTMFNKDRSKLLADIRRFEQALEIIVK